LLQAITVVLYGAIVSAVSFFAVYFLVPVMIKRLVASGHVVQDYHKPDKPKVPRPAGPALMAGIAASEIILYILTLDSSVLAILFTTAIAFVVGLVDDRKVMPGWFKPGALLLAAIPIIVLGAHPDHLNLIFGRVFIPLLYIPLVFIVIPIAGNTINSIDVLNGVASGFLIIATIPLLVSIAIFGNQDTFLAALPLLFATLAFYKYHKFPSRIFPGDSGTVLLGALFGALAVAGSSEIIGVIVLLPAVMNSFLFLASVKKIIEHRQVKARPVTLLGDFRLAASKDKSAPITLVRLILADGPLGEREIGIQIFKLAVFAAIMALASIGIQYYFLKDVIR
jgi:UDP-N-acetylglucosamine--dolichyl-phosphate N-acetylglucosaminephosphotransferase